MSLPRADSDGLDVSRLEERVFLKELLFSFGFPFEISVSCSNAKNPF